MGTHDAGTLTALAWEPGGKESYQLPLEMASLASDFLSKCLLNLQHLRRVLRTLPSQLRFTGHEYCFKKKPS